MEGKIPLSILLSYLLIVKKAFTPERAKDYIQS